VCVSVHCVLIHCVYARKHTHLNSLYTRKQHLLNYQNYRQREEHIKRFKEY